MKQYINFFILALSISCNLQASLPVQYWNDNVHKPKSTIQKNIPLQEKCNLTVAMIKERKTINLEKSIPLLMEVYTKEIHTLPEVILTGEHKDELTKTNNFINYMTKSVTSGSSYEVFKSVIDKEPLLQKQNISLNQVHGYIPHIIWYCIIGGTAGSLASTIIIAPGYHATNDGNKLFVMNHELQHQRNGINHNRTLITKIQKKCIFSDLRQTPYVRSILKSNIKNPEKQNLQDILDENGAALNKEYRRYEEFRADTRAIENMHCPLCVKEASMCERNNQGYRQSGYLYQWQFQPRIDQLKKQGTICLHHHENGERIDTSICNGSTLKKRMIILQKNK